MTPTPPTTTPAVDAIQAYVCPNCGSYYASSSSADLRLQENIRSSLQNLATEDPAQWGKVTGTRAECQHCKHHRGVTVQRELVTFVRLAYVQEAIEAGK